MNEFFSMAGFTEITDLVSLELGEFEEMPVLEAKIGKGLLIG